MRILGTQSKQETNSKNSFSKNGFNTSDLEGENRVLYQRMKRSERNMLHWLVLHTAEIYAFLLGLISAITLETMTALLGLRVRENWVLFLFALAKTITWISLCWIATSFSMRFSETKREMLLEQGSISFRANVAVEKANNNFASIKKLCRLRNAFSILFVVAMLLMVSQFIWLNVAPTVVSASSMSISDTDDVVD